MSGDIINIILIIMSAYGFFCVIRGVSKFIMKKARKTKCVIIETDCESAECVVRCVMSEFEGAEIVAVNSDDGEKTKVETKQILEKLAKDYPQVHIVT